MLKKIKTLFGAQDMTTGSPFICLLKFSLPMLIGNIAQMMYTTVDRVVVGQYVRIPGLPPDTALGAVGVTMPILNLFFVFFMAVGSGVTIMVSQFYGAKDKDNLGRAIGNSITLIIITSVVVTAAALPLTGPILRLLKTRPEMYQLAYDYLFILFIGTAANGFYNVMSGMLRGLGDAIYPFLVLFITVVLNAFMVIWFVAPWGLGMGIKGAAWATVICQTLSAVACVLRVIKMKGTLYTLNRTMLKLKAATVKQIARLGLPSGIQMAIMFLSNIVTQPMLMQMGELAMPSLTATMSVDGFAVLPAQAFSMAASTYTGQNIGAGKMDRVKKGTLTVFLMCFFFSGLMVAAIQIFGKYIFQMFTDTDILIALCRRYLLLMLPAYLIMTVNMSLTGVMRGAGDSIGTMWISVLTNVVLRLPLTFLIAHLTRGAQWVWQRGTEPVVWENGSPESLFYAMLISITVGSLVSLIYYRIGRWKTKSIVRTPTVAAEV